MTDINTADRDRLQSRLDDAVKALEPFAAFAHEYDESWHDEYGLTCRLSDPDDVDFTVGNLRAATNFVKEHADG